MLPPATCGTCCDFADAENSQFIQGQRRVRSYSASGRVRHCQHEWRAIRGGRDHEEVGGHHLTDVVRKKRSPRLQLGSAAHHVLRDGGLTHDDPEPQLACANHTQRSRSAAVKRRRGRRDRTARRLFDGAEHLNDSARPGFLVRTGNTWKVKGKTFPPAVGIRLTSEKGTSATTAEDYATAWENPHTPAQQARFDNRVQRIR